MSVHELTFPNTDSKEYVDARHHYLLQIIFGETIAIDYCKTMATFAPNNEARDFLLQQQKEEEIHLEMLTDYIVSHPGANNSISKYIIKMDKILGEILKRKDYISMIFVQNFIVEGINVTLLEELEHHADGELSQICRRLLKDETKHAEFGVSEMKRIFNETVDIKMKNNLIWLQRKTFYYAIKLSLTLSKESKNMGVPMNEFTKRVLQAHWDRIITSNFPVSLVDRIFFKGSMFLFKAF